ncbi:MAG: hypothetical protein WEB52_12420 [Dehalococcoidia bacterium]
MTTDIATLLRNEPDAIEPGVIATGSGFRAVVRHQGEIVWQCPHVHFTDHSAKACNALAALLRGAWTPQS